MTSAGTNVTRPGNSFVGRESELSELERAFDGGARLVTLVGAPGTGKTRLARHYALARAPALAPPMAGGVWWIDLASARSFEHAAAAVARVVGISLTRDESAGALSAHLAQLLSAYGPMLIVLDDFEQLVREHALDVARLVEGAPHLEILVTSRERLSVGAEHTVELEPLALPAVSHPLSAPAARLFVDRARAVRSNYAPESDPDEAQRVAEIVRLLDGLPLPIELAAARMGVLGSAKLIERLRERRLDLLSRSARDAAPRHASLRAALEWSWELLPEDARRALETCSVFAGEFDLDAAEAILQGALAQARPSPGGCASAEREPGGCDSAEREPGGGAPQENAHAIDALHRLRDASLLRLSSDAEPRFSLLASVRELARERLAVEGVQGAAEARHGAYFAALADGARRRWIRYGDVAARRALESAADELREVLARGDADASAACALGLDVVLAVHGPLASHRQALVAARSLASGADLARVLAASSALELRAGHARRALELAREAHSLAPDALALVELTRSAIACACDLPQTEGHGGERWSCLWVDLARAMQELALGRAAESAERARLLVASADELGDRRASAEAREVLALAMLALGRAADAAELVHRAIDERRALGEPFALVRAIAIAARVAAERGEDAEPAHRAALNVARAYGFASCEAEVLASLALDRLDAGEVVKAREAAEHAVRAARTIDVPSVLVSALVAHGLALLAGSDAHDAREPFGEALALRPLPEMDAIARAGVAAATRHTSGEPPESTSEACVPAALLFAIADPSRASASLRAARGLEPHVQRVRVAARLLLAALPERERRATCAEALDPESAALVVGPAACWFRPPGGELVELDRKQKPAALLSALSAARSSSEAPMGHAELVAEVWPGEKILPSAAKDRLYATVALLRRAGLGDHVQSEPTGYRLDPHLRVIRVG